MERKVYHELLAWKQKKGRKPLILTGARQVGKTWLMQEFGRREYSKTRYVNFDLDERLKGLFEHDYDIPHILMTLQALTGVKATPGDTLIIFDEIQEVNRGLRVLKYFCENAPEYHVMVAMPDVFIYYWSSERSDGELDFFIQKGSRIIPIEVKAEEIVRAKSLRHFILANPSLKGIRFSMADYQKQDWMTNIRLFAVGEIEK